MRQAKRQETVLRREKRSSHRERNVSYRKEKGGRRENKSSLICMTSVRRRGEGESGTTKSIFSRGEAKRSSEKDVCRFSKEQTEKGSLVQTQILRCFFSEKRGEAVEKKIELPSPSFRERPATGGGAEGKRKKKSCASSNRFE